MERTRRAMPAFAAGLRPGCGFDPRCGRRMVPLRMGDADVGQRFGAHRIEERPDVRFIERTRIDDRNLPNPDDVSDGPSKGERSNIVAEESAHAWAHLLDLPRCKIEAL